MDAYLLKIRQALPLDMKIKYTQRRIQEWVEYWGGVTMLLCLLAVVKIAQYC